MRVLGIVCSPRKAGNKEIMIKEALESARQARAEIDIFLMADKNIQLCDGCGACVANGICKINDDMQELYRKLESADAVVFGTPVYFVNVTAQAKAIIDRTYALLWTRKLRGKVAAAIVTTRKVGASQAQSILYRYFISQRMIVSGGAIGYGAKRGEVREGEGCSYSMSAMEEARAVGKSVVRLWEQLSKGKG